MNSLKCAIPTIPGFQVYDAPKAKDIPDSSLQFLQQLDAPTIIKIPGKTAKTRAVITLLHGNEPSGFAAIHRLLKEGFVPETNTVFAIVSVAAALRRPFFHYRFSPDAQDINRCFRPPYDSPVHILAKQLISFLVDASPEAILDVHNTSGSGPAFSVGTRTTTKHTALSSHFTRWFIHTDMQLGALMEVPFGCPVVTIESGGALDEQSTINAYNGIRSYLTASDVFEPKQDLQILQHPKRLELHSNVGIAYADRPVFGANVTMRQDIEQCNFGITQPGDILGWVDHDQLEHFRLAGQQRNESLDHYFTANNNVLTVRRPLKFFMVTTRPDIATNDCLLYFVESNQIA